MLVSEIGEILRDLVKPAFRLLLAQLLGYRITHVFKRLGLCRGDRIKPNQVKSSGHPYHLADITRLL